MSVFPPLPPPQINILDLFLPENQGGRLDVPFSVRLEKEEEDYDVFSSASSEDIFWIWRSTYKKCLSHLHMSLSCLFDFNISGTLSATLKRVYGQSAWLLFGWSPKTDSSLSNVSFSGFLKDEFWKSARWCWKEQEHHHMFLLPPQKFFRTSGLAVSKSLSTHSCSFFCFSGKHSLAGLVLIVDTWRMCRRSGFNNNISLLLPLRRRLVE